MGSLAEITINWRSALMFAICFPMIVVAIMLFFRREERRANAFLGVLLLAVVIVQIPQIIGFSGFYSIWPELTFFPFDTELYLGSLFYLHAWTLIHDKPLRWRWWLLVPGILQTLYYAVAFTTIGDYKAKWAYNGKIHEPYIQPIETILAVIFVLVSLFYVSRMIRDYEVFLTETQSAKADFEPIWLRRLISALILAGIIFTLFQIANLITGGVRYETGFPVQIILTGIIAWLGLEALSRTSKLYPKHYQPAQTAGGGEKPKQRDWEKDGQAIKIAIKEGAWYLSPTLSLRGLAARMGSNETYVSRAINLGLKTNFNRLINRMRIEHAKSLFATSKGSILSIALDSGFNSKATFNRVFREIEGQTPTQYRVSIL